MNIIEFGDCRTTMRRWAALGFKAQMCVTSPPYFGLRDYGHEGQIGLEQTSAEYVASMVEVFRCVWDVLADDGVLWLNLGDSYARNPAKGGSGPGGKNIDYSDAYTNAARHLSESKGSSDGKVGRAARAATRVGDLAPKQLLGIPWRVALALQADGWYLRQDIIWNKPNPMPESVTDRCTKAHEYIFMLTKSPRYYYDAEAIKEPAVGANMHDVTGRSKQRGMADTFKRKGSKREQAIPGQTVGTHREDRPDSDYDLFTRNRRSVWTVATRPYKGAHFATYPPALIEPCILATSRPDNIVLDPFMGSGTTAQVALQHGRQYMGCELNPEYEGLQRERISSC